MATLAYIEASPRKDRSASIAVAEAFLETYRENHPEDTIDKMDVWAMDLPPFDGYTINAKYRILHGEEFSDEEGAAWDAVKQLCERFSAADKFLFSLPMWNFGIPYKLKHFVDVITQPGLTFSFSPEAGYAGLVTGKPVAVVYARGGAYQGDMAGYDLQKSYMEAFLQFIGFADIETILIEPTLVEPAQVQQVRAAATEQARKVAQAF